MAFRANLGKNPGVKRQYIGPFIVCLFAGLATAQVIATLHVHLSNTSLFHTLTTIDKAGYLAVPNGWIIRRLQSFAPAFYGGLFFTFSAGVGITLLSCGAMGLWNICFSRNRLCLMILLALWLGCFPLINLHGFNPFTSAYLALIPIVVFLISWRAARIEAEQKDRLPFKIPALLPVILLACSWGFLMDKNLFLNIRDNLLLSNPVGMKISDFYYKYSFYPAEILKPLHGRSLKTCNLDRVKPPLKASLDQALRLYDYLNIKGNGDVDLLVEGMGGTLIFRNRGNAIMGISFRSFMANPAEILEEFSLKTDRYGFFRRFIFFSLLAGSPLILYVFTYGLLRMLFHPFWGWRISGMMAAACCFLAGLLLLMAVYGNMLRKPDKENRGRILLTAPPRERISVLRSFESPPVEDVSDFAAYEQLLKSPHIPDRYWLAWALGKSRNPETVKDLLGLLNDASPNVVSMAFYSLGRRGDKRVAPEILKRLKSSGSWYNQWYAYRALRSLGWTQAKAP